MENLSINVSAQDLSILQRIAKQDNRRFQDFCTLIFSEGLRCFYCEDIVSIKLEDHEIDSDTLEKIKINEALYKTEGYYKLSDEEKIEKGFTPGINRHLSNFSYTGNDDDKHIDNLIDPIADRIKSYALE